jgi:hypothetical protein
MSEGFGEESIEVSINKNEVNKILKKYKKIKKYMKSPVFQIKQMEGTETIVRDLLKEMDADK